MSQEKHSETLDPKRDSPGDLDDDLDESADEQIAKARFPHVGRVGRLGDLDDNLDEPADEGRTNANLTGDEEG